MYIKVIFFFFFFFFFSSVSLMGKELAIFDFNRPEQLGKGFSYILSSRFVRIENINIMNRDMLRYVLHGTGNIDEGNLLNETVGLSLGADYLLGGDVKENNNKITVNYQLFDVKNSKILIKETVTSEKENIAFIHLKIIEKICEILSVPLADDIKKDLALPINYNAFENFSKGLNLYEENKFNEGRDFFFSSIKNDPYFSYSYLYLEKAAKEAGMVNELIKDYENLLYSFPDNYLLMNYLACLYMEQGRAEDGERLLKKSITLSPSFYEAYQNIAFLYCSRKKYSEAIHELEEGVKYSPFNALLYYNIGLCYSAMNNKEKSIEYYNEALRLAPVNPDFSEGRKIVFSDRADISYKKKKIPGAIVSEVIINNNGENYTFSVIDKSFNSIDKGRLCAERLLCLLQNDIYFDNITVVMNGQNAIIELNGLFIMEITEEEAIREGLSVHVMANSMAEILKYFFPASVKNVSVMGINQSPLAVSLLYKGDTFYNQGDLDRAVKEYENILKSNKEFAPAYYSLGVVSYDKKTYSNAQNYFLKAIKYDSKYLDAYIWLGKSYIQEEKFSKAKDILNKALKFSPGNSEIKTLLDKI